MVLVDPTPDRASEGILVRLRGCFGPARRAVPAGGIPAGGGGSRGGEGERGEGGIGDGEDLALGLCTCCTRRSSGGADLAILMAQKAQNPLAMKHFQRSTPLWKTCGKPVENCGTLWKTVEHSNRGGASETHQAEETGRSGQSPGTGSQTGDLCRPARPAQPFVTVCV